jgi:putative transposase
MLKAFKYRIYPTKAQRSKMEQTLELCRWTYNETLAYLLPEWKKNKPELKGGILSDPPERPRTGRSGL